MSLRRSLRFGRHLTEPPSYDPETTGLLVYNDLALAGRADVPDSLRASILRSRVLSVCEGGPKTRAQIGSDIKRVLEAVTVRLAGCDAAAEVDIALDSVIKALISEGLLEAADGGYRQTSVGRTELADHVAASRLLEERFDRSMMTRIERLSLPLGVKPAAPAKVCRAFFREAVRRRALGVALAFATGGSAHQQEYHALALMQSIGDWLDKAENEAEALVVVEAIQEVFREPTKAESEYLGVSIQARFVLHLLGLDEDTLGIRMRELAQSVFLVDSTTLIPWLAVGGAGNDAASVLIERLQEAGAVVATTAPLVSEAAEHARWAQRAIREAGDVQSVPVFEAATGRAGTRSNAFLDAYLAFIATRGPTPFDVYLAHCLGRPSVSDPVTDGEFVQAVTNAGIDILSFDSAAASDPTLFSDRGAYEHPIKERRLANTSFKHDRQVRTEAEAIALVERARGGTLEVSGATVQNGYFLSYTSLLNDIARSPTPVTMKPEAALSWLSTLRPSGREESRVLVSEMLWELQERRMNLVDQATLITAFGPLLKATRRDLDEVVPKYQALVAQRFGGEQPSLAAPVEVPELDLPVYLDVLQAGRLRQLEEVVAEQAVALQKAKAREEAAEEAAAELEKLRTKQKRKDKYDRQMARRRDRR
jgi:CRP-like cAMP-binding protein